MFFANTKQIIANEFFSKVFSTKKLSRSYLLLGDNLVDKLDFALAITKILNCLQNKSVWQDLLYFDQNQNSLFVKPETHYQAACETCQNCLWINENSHAVTPIFVETSGAKKLIQIDAVRKLQEELSQSSEYFRVVIFKEASFQSLNKHSSAALLKTIEEAKANTMFLFFADAKQNVLSTIVSRCQSVNFLPGEQDDIKEEVFDLKQKITQFLESAQASNELARIVFVEELAQRERDDLIEAFSLIEKDIASNTNIGILESQAIRMIEELIYDIKSFVKVKLALKNAFDKLQNLELTYARA